MNSASCQGNHILNFFKLNLFGFQLRHILVIRRVFLSLSLSLSPVYSAMQRKDGEEDISLVVPRYKAEVTRFLAFPMELPTWLKLRAESSRLGYCLDGLTWSLSLLLRVAFGRAFPKRDKKKGWVRKRERGNHHLLSMYLVKHFTHDFSYTTSIPMNCNLLFSRGWKGKVKILHNLLLLLPL